LNQDNDSEVLQSEWEAKELPKGSLAQLITRSRCPVCRLILHIFSPLPTKAFLKWTASKPLTLLESYRYCLQYRGEHRIHVRTEWPRSGGFRDVGFIETLSDDYELKLEQHAVWQSCNLSSAKWWNLSWAQSSDLDFLLIRKWLKHCDRKHSRCGLHGAVKIHASSIRLVDVRDLKIVTSTTNTAYFALSYVWGGVSMLRATKTNILELEQPGSLRDHSDIIPQTIRDAMEFVHRLGERYLWVDTLCILQDDQMEKHSQISQMHEIYSAAYATIVQQSGVDANGGLPGVRTGSRSMLATKSSIRGDTMIATSNYAVPDILHGTVHSSRGWTLQETMVSNRCLHFFDKQVTFVCAEEFAQDWRSTSLDAASRDIHRFRIPSHALWQMNPIAGSIRSDTESSKQSKWLRSFEIYARVMSDYTSRQLSYESDILNAFQGLTSAILRLSSGSFFYGLPSISFDHALLWLPLSSNQTRRILGERRIPSWSWAGWTGQSTYNCCSTRGGPSHWFHLNSFVKDIHIVENGVSSRIERLSGSFFEDEECSSYFKARNIASEPSIILERTLKWPQGCLHFWAEEANLDQFDFRFSPARNAGAAADGQSSLFPFLFPISSTQPCGILAPTSDFLTSDLSAPDSSTSSYSLVLMSESRQALLEWKTNQDDGLTEMVDFADRHVFLYKCPFYFNVLLVKRAGLFVERIAYGQIHPDAWLGVKRLRRYIRMI
jgi:hypothetical protein